MTIDNIISAYSDLCSFCDTFWKQTAAAYPDQFACGKGCSICCELETVVPLEAYVIFTRLHEPGSFDKSNLLRTSSCPFLHKGLCAIYRCRPVICRTHGLPLSGRDIPSGLTVSCSFNFTTTELASINKEFFLDIDKVNENLIRLNFIFCSSLGNRELASQRILLKDILTDRLPEEILKTKRGGLSDGG